MTEDSMGKTNQDDAAPWTEPAGRETPLSADEAEAMGIGGNPSLGREGQQHADNDNDEPLSEGDMTVLTRTD